ncbi:hypothetical protein ABTZ57_18210 [Streptomyces sp. NPDC094048]|uniref:hypothetical protein n=1 Tax=unclassified Streptomyces TaxID=2593676 RepID=UPI003325F625
MAAWSAHHTRRCTGFQEDPGVFARTFRTLGLAELTELGLGSAPAAQIWRDLMSVDLSFFRSETSERLRSEGRAEGRAEDILRILSKRGIAVSEQVRERVVSCSDPDVPGEWLDRSLTAEVAEDLFVATKA